MSATELGLHDLVAPLTVDAFRADHWAPGLPSVTRASDALMTALRSFEELRDIRTLLKKRTADVGLFGPKGFRSDVSPRRAADFLDAGFNLYVTSVERDLPALRTAMMPIARDLGLTPNQTFIEVFAGRAGQVSTRHYDHDINFQILLAGDKTWTLQANTTIENPMVAFHPQLDAATGKVTNFAEEAFTRDRAIPLAFDDSATYHDVTAGSVLFLPRGHWHEVTSRSDTLSVNLVLKGLTFSAGLGGALEARLQRDPRARAYFDGLTVGDTDPVSRQAEFARIKAAALAELAAITFEEAALVSFRNQVFSWAAAAADRRVSSEPPSLHVPAMFDEPIELDAESGPCVAALVALQYPFTWNHALALLADIGAIAARNLIEELLTAGLLETKS